jgi:hypothetical protein
MTWGCCCWFGVFAGGCWAWGCAPGWPGVFGVLPGGWWGGLVGVGPALGWFGVVGPGWVEEFGVPLFGVEARSGPVPVEGEGVDVGVPVDGDAVLGGVDWAGFWCGVVVLGFCPGVWVRVPAVGSVVLPGGVRLPGGVFPGLLRGAVPSPGVVLPGVR